MTLSGGDLEDILRGLESPPIKAAATGRQPVHTLYGGAHLFKAATARNMGALALKSLETHGGGPSQFGAALGILPTIAENVYQRVVSKLTTEAVEDYRLDFEDGYGNRPDEEEDGHAVHAAQEMLRGLEQNSLPPFIGIRIKPLTPASRGRSIRTLDLFLTTLGGKLPGGFVVTLPKVTSPREVAALDQLLTLLERAQGLATGTIRMELMVETTESLFDTDGRVALPALVSAAQGRCRGMHFGAYDYTAALDIAAEQQTLDHPACDFARQIMQASLAGRGLMLSDGAFNLLPLPPGDVRQAWRLHFEQIQRSLWSGFYQGWDLHPAQLPARYAAVYAFFRESLPATTTRLRNFVQQAAQATRVGQVFDDAATGRGLVNFFVRGTGCGALDEEEVLTAGLSLDALKTAALT